MEDEVPCCPIVSSSAGMSLREPNVCCPSVANDLAMGGTVDKSPFHAMKQLDIPEILGVGSAN
jgi:hypothetical protein